MDILTEISDKLEREQISAVDLINRLNQTKHLTGHEEDSYIFQSNVKNMSLPKVQEVHKGVVKVNQTAFKHVREIGRTQGEDEQYLEIRDLHVQLMEIDNMLAEDECEERTKEGKRDTLYGLDDEDEGEAYFENIENMDPRTIVQAIHNEFQDNNRYIV